MKYRKSITVDDKKEFVRRVLEMYDQDLLDRADWSERRIQRYAKLFGWLEPKHYPWPNASNQHVPMLMTNSQRTQDTLQNAALTARPLMSASAINKGDAEKGKVIDQLQDYQFFVEQNGEEKLGALADSFVNDSRFIAFIPWVKEKKKSREVLKLDPIPANLDPSFFYEQFLAAQFPDAAVKQVGKPEDCTYALVEQKPFEKDPQVMQAEFYSEDDTHFCLLTRDKVIFDAPCVIPKALEDIIVPSRCENLQPPTPSNPLGADHVIMVDYPSWDEINRLQKKDYYDLLTDEDMNPIETKVEAEVGDHSADTFNDPEQHKVEMDSLAGMQYGNAKSTSKTFTRLTFFGRWKFPDEDFEEEIVARVILGSGRNIKALARLRYLEEEYPREDLSRPRPFAVSPAFIPIPGQFYGMGLLELLEHMSDLTKIILDQAIDKHTICNTPWFLYRSASGVRPEVIKMEPGMGYPVNNPQQDLMIPQFPQDDQAMAMNIIALVQQWSEKQSMQGSLQMGAVPQGKASALRTSTNMMAIMQQGDARPERILRRFFKGMAEVYQQMHELNKVFLPPNKQYRITGVSQAGSDPYQVVQNVKEIQGMFQFDFKANSLNTTKAIQSQILAELMPMLINPLILQAGIQNPVTIYNLLSDYIQSVGQDQHRYLVTPPDADAPKITAEQAMGQMVQGQLPQGVPAEGAMIHLQNLMAFQQDPRFINLVKYDQAFQTIFQTYVQQVQVKVQQQQMQMQMAQQFMQQNQQGAQPGPAGQVDPGAGQMQPQGPNQVIDESMPSAKGMMQ